MSNEKIMFTFEKSYPCHPKYIQEIRNEFQKIAEKYKIPMAHLFKLELVIDEACMNAIDHGSALNKEQDFDFSIEVSEKKITILVRDYGGKSFDPQYFEAIAHKKTWGHGGRGIFLIKSIMDEVMYCFNKGRSTLLVMTKYL